MTDVTSLSRTRRLIIRSLKRFGPMTDNQIISRLRKNYKTPPTPTAVRHRRLDLESAGLVYLKAQSPDTGELVWSLTKAGQDLSI